MITLAPNKNNYVIKRSGASEPYTEAKQYAVLLWAAEGKEVYAKDILEDMNIKIHNQIHSSKLLDVAIETTANKISEMFPFYDTIARNLYLQKIYKETWNIKRTENSYPHYSEVLAKGVKLGIYSKEIISSFTSTEIDELHNMIDQSRDFKFDYLGLNVFMDKMSMHSIELPQHGFMRLAIFAFWKEPDRLNLIKQRYDDMSNFIYSEATPKWLSSLRDQAQMASCVVSVLPDDSRGINKTISNLGLFSKYGGGLATDISHLRASGSRISTTGKSSGPIPFVRMLESVVTAYNQLGARKGACAVYCNWWHYDILEILKLKNEGGPEEKRARQLMYGFKSNSLIIPRFIKDEHITLFDPKDTPELLKTTGKEFEKWYHHYEQKIGIRKKTIPARTLIYEMISELADTGNWYQFFIENVHNQTPFNEYINSSNLCNEIYLPTRPPVFKDHKLSKQYGQDNLSLTEEYDPGMIALCNLSSINSVVWMTLTPEQKNTTMYNLLKASDNLMNYAYYPVLEGLVSNTYYQSIGIGLSNVAQYFAMNKTKFTDESGKQLMFSLMEDIAYYVLSNSVKLAQERGVFEGYHNTKWKDGWLPIDTKSFPYKYNYDWSALRQSIMTHGVRFATHLAIAPTATSSLVIGATEGVQPVKNLVSDKTGNYSCKQIVPNLHKYREYYQLVWDIPNKTHIDYAAIRQHFIDQGQSTDTYYKVVASASEIIDNIFYAQQVGLKGLYYMNSLKLDEHEVCASCSA